MRIHSSFSILIKILVNKHFHNLSHILTSIYLYNAFYNTNCVKKKQHYRKIEEKNVMDKLKLQKTVP